MKPCITFSLWACSCSLEGEKAENQSCQCSDKGTALSFYLYSCKEDVKREVISGSLTCLSNLISPSFSSSEASIHWLSCIATQSWSIIILINALWSWIVQWVSCSMLCMLKETLLLAIFRFWIESHPYMFLNAPFPFLGKESKCSNMEITVLVLRATKAFQVLSDKGSLANIFWVPASLAQRKQKALLPFSWPLTNHQTNPSPSSHSKKHSSLRIHKAALMRPNQTVLVLTFQSEAKPKFSKYANRTTFFLFEAINWFSRSVI